MRSFIGSQEVVNASELAEIALGMSEEDLPEGIDIDLFRGPLSAESPADRAARLDAGRAILADLAAQAAQGDEVAAEDAAYALALTRAIPFCRRNRTARVSGGGEAA
ncbi:hypothetical protein AB0M28_33775 [Streptomyces sp. NPDC051940]|uniref:hypothetical protein n=1 Tax=Streptomyces sp. NPDC051940 TaxID=3155675 RepID=UPI0034169747